MWIWIRPHIVTAVDPVVDMYLNASMAQIVVLRWAGINLVRYRRNLSRLDLPFCIHIK